MVVEYMSSIVMGLVVIFLSPLGWFKFATSEEISPETVMYLCMYQMVPELFMDFFITFVEVYGGLKPLHESYWNADSGADPAGGNAFIRSGDLLKGAVIKSLHTMGLIGFVLMLSMK